MPPDGQFDYFISYAHADDKVMPGAQRGWVSIFMDGLETLVQQKTGVRNLRPWTDRSELSASDELDQQIKDALNSAKVLIVILSPSYFTSSYCRMERNFFCHAHPDYKNRIVVVELDQIPDEQYDEMPFPRRKALQFWALKENKWTRQLGHPEPNPQRDGDYYERVHDSAAEVAEKLKQLRSPQPLPPGPEAPALSVVHGREEVAIAEVTDDQRQRAERLVRRLQDAGTPYRLIDSRGKSTADFVQAIDDDLRRSAHFVQLLGAYPGRNDPDAPKGYVYLQYDRALRQAPELTIHQWRDPDLSLAGLDFSYQPLLEGKDVRAFDVFQEDLVRKLMSSPAAPRASGGDAHASAQKHVFLNYDERDAGVARELIEQIPGDVLPPPPADTDQEYREAVQQQLIDCDDLLIVFGESGDKWVYAQINSFVKIKHKRTKDLKQLVVVRTPPPTRELPPMKVAGLKVVDWATGKLLSELGVSFS